MALKPGTHLGPYEITAPLGSGGMGEVYRAHDRRLDRDVAIKVLPDDVAGDSERLARFEREAKTVAKLSHPNILEIFDFGREADVTYAVTELLEGETLFGRLEGGQLGWRTVTEIGAAIEYVADYEDHWSSVRSLTSTELAEYPLLLQLLAMLKSNLHVPA